MCTTLPTRGWKSYNPSFTHKPYTYPCAQHCQHKDGNPTIHHLPINPIHTHVHNIANTRMAILQWGSPRSKSYLTLTLGNVPSSYADKNLPACYVLQNASLVADSARQSTSLGKPSTTSLPGGLRALFCRISHRQG
jgi:hypothetical protein